MRWYNVTDRWFESGRINSLHSLAFLPLLVSGGGGTRGAEKTVNYIKGSFVTIPNKEALRGQPSETQTIYLWICNYADMEGICYPSRKTLAKDAGVSVKTVDRHIKKLIELGLLTKTTRKKGVKENASNLYQIMLVGEGVGTESRHPSDFKDPTPRDTNDTVTKPNIELNIINSISDVPSLEIAEAIDCFRLVNDNYSKWFKNKTKRKVIAELIQAYSLQKVLKAVYLSKFAFTDTYFPNFITPEELQGKWAKVKRYYQNKVAKDKRYLEEFEKFIENMEKEKMKGKTKALEVTIAGRRIQYYAPSN